jgi:uncharacterized phiE125 gp8 family phage protein
MGLTLTTAHAERVVTVEQAKQHVRVDSDDDDRYIDSLILAATRLAESETRHSFLDTTWTYKLDGFLDPDTGRSDPIRLPRRPVDSITSITYVDGAGATQTLAASVYSILTDVEPPGLILRVDQSWPATRAQYEAVTIVFVAGYGDPADVPDPIKQAVLMTVADWYRGRETTTAANMREVPTGASRILNGYTGALI